MADSIFDVLSSTEQMRANYEKYADRFKDATAELVNSQTFLNLLVAEMTNQDPLEPTSNTEFVTQMAQLQYSQDASRYSMANYASSLVGKTATGTRMDGGELVTKTGVVSSVEKNGDKYTVIIDGVGFDLSKITKVSDTNTGQSNSGSTVGGNSLGDMISRASMMIGMYATVSAKTAGGTALDAGIISSIQVKDGEVSAVINGISYKLSDIVEVTYAVRDDDPAQNSGTTDKPAEDEEPEEVGEIDPDEEPEDLEDIEDVEDVEDPEEIEDYSEYEEILGQTEPAET